MGLMIPKEVKVLLKLIDRLVPVNVPDIVPFSYASAG
jgi:hypothetical protein